MSDSEGLDIGMPISAEYLPGSCTSAEHILPDLLDEDVDVVGIDEDGDLDIMAGILPKGGHLDVDGDADDSLRSVPRNMHAVAAGSAATNAGGSGQEVTAHALEAASADVAAVPPRPEQPSGASGNSQSRQQNGAGAAHGAPLQRGGSLSSGAAGGESSAADSSEDDDDMPLAARGSPGLQRQGSAEGGGQGARKRRKQLLPAVRRGQRCGHCHTCLNPQVLRPLSRFTHWAGRLCAHHTPCLL